MMKNFVFALALLFAWTGVSSREALALRCGTSLVSRGDRKIEVLKSCGAPDFLEKWREKRWLPPNRGFRSRHFEIIHVEEWTYNLGSSRLIHFLTFHNGRLFEMDAGDYGFNGKSPQTFHQARCGKMLSIGDRKIEVLKKCGAPSFKETLSEGTSEDASYNREEEWTYNFGSNDFLYFVGFKNSEVVRIEQGGYGY